MRFSGINSHLNSVAAGITDGDQSLHVGEEFLMNSYKSEQRNQ